MNEGRGFSARTLASLIAVAMIGVAGCSGEENTAAAVATESEQSAAESGADEAAEALPPAEPAFALPTPREAVAKDLRPFSTRMPTITFNKLTLPLVRSQLGGQGGDIPETVTERTIPGPEGSPDVTVFIADPRPDDSEKPLFLHMHGGGYVVYSARDFAPFLPTIAEACDCVVVSVDYRLAPETQFPGPRDDNFAALKWVVDNAVELGVDTNKIAVGGESAGGGHAAQLTISARDEGIPIAFQVLVYPMLDDRTGSVRDVPEHIGHYIWNAGSNTFAWSSYLGQPAGSDTVPYGAVPARLEDLSGLPPAWIGVGGVDLFMAEDITYARRLMEAGVPVEMHVVPGAFHAFDSLAEATPAAIAFRESWAGALRRALHSGS